MPAKAAAAIRADVFAQMFLREFPGSPDAQRSAADRCIGRLLHGDAEWTTLRLPSLISEALEDEGPEPEDGLPGPARAHGVPGAGMERLQALWLALRTSLWFVPALIVLAAVLLALGLIDLEPRIRADLSEHWPRLFGAGAEGSRGMLSAIATSMATVAGVVFSVTIVALSQASTQYSPRVLRNFMSDRPTQVVLGSFVAVFAYCLVVLRTIRGGDPDGFVPSIAVLGGVVMALVGIGLLIYFIHHVASSIQASSIICRIAHDTREAIDRLFPSGIGEEAPDPDTADLPEASSTTWCSLAADRSGYVVAIEAEHLLDLAARFDLVLCVVPRVGDFVTEGRPLLQASALELPAGLAESELRDAIVLGPERDVHQDAPHGLQLLVDVALRALSPSLHDPTTAVACIDHLGALLVRLTGRRIEGSRRSREGRVRLVVRGPGYAELVEIALGALIHHAGSHAVVHERLIGVAAALLEESNDVGRRAAVHCRLRAHRARLPASGLATAETARLGERIDALLKR